jgi:hypothetical protein
MVSILHDRRLQYLFLFRGGEVERRRLEFWLASALVEAREDGTLGELLRVCASFVAVVKEVPVCLVGFLLEFVKGWDGCMYRSQILDLLVAIVPSDWEGTARCEWC